MLVADGVSKSFGATPALRDASFRLGQGERVAVTGASGSGKSTLLLCAAGILSSDSGDVRFQGKSLAELSEANRSRLRRSQFGVLFQFGQLIPELTAAENVALPLLLDGVSRQPALVSSIEWLERMGVADLASRRPTQMSGGQTQRVALARALVTEPSVLFADEPTGALDRSTSALVMSRLVEAADNCGTAVLLVTHDRNIASYAHREIVMTDGRVLSTV